jgi:NADH:ubiquinone oxidoreductase subunit 5 (subunit L)/multisubunit Na+/H+ antiporter MnhA subunit
MALNEQQQKVFETIFEKLELIVNWFLTLTYILNQMRPVVNLIVRIVGYYTLQFCDYYMGMDQSEEEKYFLLLRYWLKSKGTFPLSL